MTEISRRQALSMTTAAAGTALFRPVYAQNLTTPKIAFALFDKVSDSSFGWSFEHVRGLEQARAIYGDRAQFDIIEDVPGWGNGEDEIFRQLVADGYKMIIPTSAGMMKATVDVALESTDVIFESCGGYIRAQNMSTYNIRFYEGRTVEGFLAGITTKTNRVGYIASFPIPEVIRGINAAFLAARSVNPDVVFDIVWISSWFDYEKEQQTARQLIDRGADVLFQHTSSTAPLEVAQENGAFGFGQGSDMSSAAPNAVLTSIVNNWGPYYIRRIGAFLDGTWSTTETWGGLSNEMVTMGPLLDTLPNRTTLQTQDLISRIESGQRHSFTGPIRRQDGSGWLAPGESASDSDLLTMSFYADGMTSVYPS